MSSLAMAPCHDDLLNLNFPDEDGELRILDLEDAGMGDLYFDRANFSHHHQLNDRQDIFYSVCASWKFPTTGLRGWKSCSRCPRFARPCEEPHRQASQRWMRVLDTNANS